MARLVADLLRSAASGTRRSPPWDVHEELDKSLEVIHYHFSEARGRGVREYVTPPSRLARAGSGGPGKAEESPPGSGVRSTLCMNAGDAMPGGGTVTLRTARAILPNRRPAVAVEVADTAPGSAPKTWPG